MSADANIDLLKDVAGRNPDWADREINFRPVSGGITNLNYRLDIDGIDGEIFAKIPGPGTEKFIDRRAAHSAAKQAAAAGISPRVLHFDEKSGIEFSDFVSTGYRTATTLDFQDRAVLERVIDVYRAWHATPLLPDTKTMFDQVEEHLSQVREESIELPKWAVDEVIPMYREVAERYEAAGLEIVAAHNDPMPGNFLLGDDGDVILIDFDYAGNNDRAYELALVFAEMFVNVEDTRGLVARYRGSDDFSFFSRVMLCRLIADTKWGLWGLINNAARDEEFDYYKYGTWKLYRTFLVSRHPQFRDWLEAL